MGEGDPDGPGVITLILTEGVVGVGVGKEPFPSAGEADGEGEGEAGAMVVVPGPPPTPGVMPVPVRVLVRLPNRIMAAMTTRAAITATVIFVPKVIEYIL